MLLGGAVAGGKVIADWPGLSQSALYEGRDLKPTTDLDALIAAALAQHYSLGASAGRHDPLPGNPRVHASAVAHRLTLISAPLALF